MTGQDSVTYAEGRTVIFFDTPFLQADLSFERWFILNK